MAIKRWVRDMVASTAVRYDMRSRPATEVLAEIESQLPRVNQVPDLPALRTVQEIVRAARKSVADETWKDDPFSLGQLVSHGVEVPSSSVNALLSVQLQAQFYGEPFLNREAVWVIRLGQLPFFEEPDHLRFLTGWPRDLPVVPVASPGFGISAVAREEPWREDFTSNLLDYARLYADEERSALLGDRDFDTRRLDAELAWRLAGDHFQLLRQLTLLPPLAQLQPDDRSTGRGDAELPKREQERLALARIAGWWKPMSEENREVDATVRHGIERQWSVEKREGLGWSTPPFDLHIDGSVVAPDVFLAMRFLARRMPGWDDMSEDAKADIFDRVVQLRIRWRERYPYYCPTATDLVAEFDLDTEIEPSPAGRLERLRREDQPPPTVEELPW